jgi:hypothetical protein
MTSLWRPRPLAMLSLLPLRSAQPTLLPCPRSSCAVGQVRSDVSWWPTPSMPASSSALLFIRGGSSGIDLLRLRRKWTSPSSSDVRGFSSRHRVLARCIFGTASESAEMIPRSIRPWSVKMLFSDCTISAVLSLLFALVLLLSASASSGCRVSWSWIEEV